VTDWLSDAAQAHPARLALRRANGASISYRSLNRRVFRLAARLEQAGVARGQRVAWLGRDAARGVTLMFALARLGAVFVPLNTRLTAGELLAQAALADVRLLMCERSVETQAAPLTRRFDVRSFDAPRSASIGRLPEVRLAEAAQGRNSDWALPAVQAVVFTSGTTGTPKGAQLTFGNQHAGAAASAARLGTGADDVWLLSLPLYHVGGMTIPFRALLAGASVVEYDPRGGFDPARLIRLLEAQQVTMISLVPTMLARLLDAGFQGTAALRAILLGGAAAPLNLLERAFACGLPVAPTYGLTEACSQVATLPPAAAPFKLGSVGQPLPGTTVHIQREDGSMAATDEPGEIVVHGPTVFAGYLNAPDDRALRNGALFTGDLGYLDADGDLFVVQRRTDLIVTGGENVYPAEVEAVLRGHAAVADVCVVGLPDAEWGQQVAAVIVPNSGSPTNETELQNWCRARIASYKIPRRFRMVDALPMTASGKVIRREVVSMFDKAH
jgi:O-succinylbenzoic acid--CoA ligase